MSASESLVELTQDILAHFVPDGRKGTATAKVKLSRLDAWRTELIRLGSTEDKIQSEPDTRAIVRDIAVNIDSRSRRRTSKMNCHRAGWGWRHPFAFAALAVALTALLLTWLMLASEAHAAQRVQTVTAVCHLSPHATARTAQAADAVIINGQNIESGWMHGMRVQAVTASGDHISQTDSTVPFRIAPLSSRGWIFGFQPRTITSCTVTILWGKS